MVRPGTYHALGLSDKEYSKILLILGREPTDTELAMFSVEWSEHCGYLCSRKWLKLLPKRGRYKTLIAEDAGGIIIDDLAIVFKMESHNHPSQIEPKQGAATGVGGIIRDIFTAGVRPIASLDSLRFGTLDKPYNRYLLNGVVNGIQSYGNCVGIPTVGGEIYFDESYNGNCLVNAMCIGIGGKNKLMRARAKGKGNSILYVGSSTGRDGIGGCSVLASCEFKEGEEKRPTVQIGDPFTEKCLIEATLEAINTGFIIGIKDMGAAGLTCCTTEMAAAGGVGMDIDLKYVPRRESNMQPWEVMLSESQERMLVCVKKGKEEQVLRIFFKWGLNASVIGKVTEDELVTIRDNQNIVAQVNAQDLTNAPVYDMPYKKPHYLKKLARLPKILRPKDKNKSLLKLLGSLSIASKAWVYEQYDHMVGTNTVVLPGSDAALIRLKGTKKAIAATTDCNSRYCLLNPNLGAQIAVAEAARNIACLGAHPAAVTDCLNFGNPNKPEIFWQFKEAVKGISYACKKFNIAVVSGNVSFYNESPKSAINPTPGIGMIGVLNDVSKACSQNFKEEEDVIILLGSCKEELGASEYLKEVHNLVAGKIPELSLTLEKAVQNTVIRSIEKGLLNSAHDCSEGGLAVALAECCINNKEKMIGACIDKLDYKISETALLFGESQSRIIISCNERYVDQVRKIASGFNAPFSVIGSTGGKTLEISSRKKKLISLSLKTLHWQWANALENKMKG